MMLLFEEVFPLSLNTDKTTNALCTWGKDNLGLTHQRRFGDELFKALGVFDYLSSDNFQMSEEKMNLKTK